MTADPTMHPTITPDTPELATDHISAPPIAPRIIEDATTPAEEKEREQAFDFAPTWKGRALLPFTSSRKSLFLQHRVAMGAPDLGDCLRDLDAFLADAARIIFLCSYHPTDPIPGHEVGWGILRTDRHLLQTAIDAWTDEHIPAGTEAEATLLGYRIYASSLTNRHTVAPSANRHGDDLGN